MSRGPFYPEDHRIWAWDLSRPIDRIARLADAAQALRYAFATGGSTVGEVPLLIDADTHSWPPSLEASSAEVARITLVADLAKLTAPGKEPELYRIVRFGASEDQRLFGEWMFRR